MCRWFENNENKTTPSPPPQPFNIQDPPFNIQDPPPPPPQYSTLPPSAASAAGDLAMALAALESFQAFVATNPGGITADMSANLNAMKAVFLKLPGTNPPPPPPPPPSSQN